MQSQCDQPPETQQTKMPTVITADERADCGRCVVKYVPLKAVTKPVRMKICSFCAPEAGRSSTGRKAGGCPQKSPGRGSQEGYRWPVVDLLKWHYRAQSLQW